MMTLRYQKESTLPVRAAAALLAAILLASSPASAAYITVYGAPGYSPGVGGYGGYQAFDEIARMGAVNDAGTAVVWANKYDAAGVNIAGAALRWNSSGGAELANLGVSPTGYPNSAPFAINNAGTAVGYSIKGVISGPPLGIHAVRWAASGTTATELGDLGSSRSLAYDINEIGTAVGYSWKVNAGTLAVRWNASGTTPTQLGHLGTNADGYTSAAATAINDAGTAIGYCMKFTSSGTSLGRYAVRWNASGTAATELGHVGTVPPYDSFYSYGPTAALGINNAGTVVGYCEELVEGQTDVRPVRWDASSTVPTVLSPPGWPHRINDAGVAVGEGPTRWDASGAASPLESQGNFSGIAKDINEAGVAVGVWEVGSRFNAVYWNPDGTGVDLNSLIDPASGWTLNSAEDISDTGWIFGIGGFDPDGPGGQAAYGRSFIMQVPATVPEPSGLVLDTLAFSALLRRRRSVRAACCEMLEGRRLLSFTLAGSYNVGADPQDVICADFNNDSAADLAVANWTDNTVSVLLGHGDGTFAPAPTAATGGNPHALTVGDFNRDGALDLASANALDVSILLAQRDAAGHGTGSFQPAVTITFADFSYPQSMHAGDFNGDGLLDIATAIVFDSASQGPSSAAAVLRGDGQGNFSAPQYTGPNENNYNFTAVAAKFNGDAFDDFVAVSSIGTVVVRLGSSTGLQYSNTFSVPADYAYSIAAGRLDGDAHMDLLIGDFNGNVTVLRGNGAGGFSSVGVFATGAPVTDLALADFNGDGELDVAASKKLLEGRGDGTLAPAVDLPAGDAYAVAVGDFNGDGRPDVAAANTGSNNVAVLLNDGVWAGQTTPQVQIGDATVTEGNTGTASASFTVTLSAPSTQPVTVAYATGNSSATAGSDYQAASGTLTFAPGQTSKTLTVLVNGDRFAEPNETFVVNLSSPTNATIADAQGVGTIVDDEPRITINDVSKAEGKNGNTSFTFTVSLSAASDQPVTVSYRTVDGTATAGSDYTSASGAITFAPGQTTKTITIQVKGDNKPEPNETFYLELFSNSSNSVLTRTRGIGTILDDDNWTARIRRISQPISYQ
jgi:hypothetical protein